MPLLTIAYEQGPVIPRKRCCGTEAVCGPEPKCSGSWGRKRPPDHPAIQDYRLLLRKKIRFFIFSTKFRPVILQKKRCHSALQSLLHDQRNLLLFSEAEVVAPARTNWNLKPDWKPFTHRRPPLFSLKTHWQLEGTQRQQPKKYFPNHESFIFLKQIQGRSLDAVKTTNLMMKIT